MNELTVTLGSPIDPQGNEVTLTVDLGAAEDFLELDGLVIKLKTDLAEGASVPDNEIIAPVKVKLTAFVEEQKISSEYSFTIELKPPAPKEDLKDTEQSETESTEESE